VFHIGGAMDDSGAVHDPDFVEALESARRGDEDAMRTIFRAYQPMLVRYLRHRAGDAAEDLASDTWLAVAQGLPRFVGGPDELRAWLFAVARNKIVDHYRSAGRRVPLVERDDRDDCDSHIGLGATVVEDHAEVVSARLDAQESIRRLVEHLPADQAEVVLLRVVGDLSVAQVAQIMGRSAGSVRVLQHRALKSLARSTLVEALRPGSPR